MPFGRSLFPSSLGRPPFPPDRLLPRPKRNAPGGSSQVPPFGCSSTSVMLTGIGAAQAGNGTGTDRLDHIDGNGSYPS